MDLTVLYQLSYGVYIVGANDGGRPTGCVINTCMQITSSPQTIAISLNKENYTYDVIRRTNQFVFPFCRRKRRQRLFLFLVILPAVTKISLRAAVIVWKESFPLWRKIAAAIFFAMFFP